MTADLTPAQAARLEDVDDDYDQDERTPCTLCGDHRGDRVAWCEQQQLAELRATWHLGMGSTE